MKSSQRKLPSIILSLIVLNAGAAALYVDVNSANPASPYTSWATAATTIQQAIDVALAGDEILVTNGVYQTGARAVYGMSNRVAVTKPVTVQSVNGPAHTSIVGYRHPGSINGASAIRCAYLADGAVLSGFTLTNGATQTSTSSDGDTNQSGGGVWCETANAVVTNCVLTGNSAFWVGGGARGGTLNNCVLTSNRVAFAHGGGAYEGTLNNCVLTGNSASGSGGGAFRSTLNHCTLVGNSASDGGGSFGGTLNHCTVTGNSAYDDGGGASGGTLNNCTLTGNSARYDGGAAYEGTLNYCVLTGNSADRGGGSFGGTLKSCKLTVNSAASYGGGANGGALNHCTLTGNSAGSGGGGASGGTLNNCIAYYNTVRVTVDNYSGSGGILNYCCTTPLPASGTGNISDEPQLASTSHLSASSPCRGAGSAVYATDVDLDGEPWANPPSIGCNEYWSGSVTGTLSVAIMAAYTKVSVGFAVDFQALIEGRVSASRWNFGDGVIVSNRPYASHAWTAPGEYVVGLRAYNESYPAGVVASVTVQVVAPPVHYVSVTSVNPVAPYTGWATAAMNIQNAVDATTVPGAVIQVSNGVYQTGARAVYGMSNRVAVTKPVTVQSVNGPAYTSIVGYRHPGTTNGASAIRCVYLTNGAVLSGFTLTNGATQTAGNSYTNRCGGGVWCESVTAVVTNCVLTGNSAVSGGGAPTSARSTTAC